MGISSNFKSNSINMSINNKLTSNFSNPNLSQITNLNPPKSNIPKKNLSIEVINIPNINTQGKPPDTNPLILENTPYKNFIPQKNGTPRLNQNTLPNQNNLPIILDDNSEQENIIESNNSKESGESNTESDSEYTDRETEETIIYNTPTQTTENINTKKNISRKKGSGN